MNELQRQVLQSRQIRIEMSVTTNAVPDNRYSIMVSLVRSDRPRVWTFLCMGCGAKVCDIVNREVYDIADFYDAQNVNNSGTLKQCKGSTNTGRACPYSYFFNMN